MEAGFALIVLITFSGLVLLILSFILWTSPKWTRRIEHALDVIEKWERDLTAKLSAICRCGHVIGQYIHSHLLGETHLRTAMR